MLLVLVSLMGCGAICGKCDPIEPCTTLGAVDDLNDSAVADAREAWASYEGNWAGATMSLSIGDPVAAEWLVWDDSVPGLGGDGCAALTAPLGLSVSDGATTIAGSVPTGLRLWPAPPSATTMSGEGQLEDGRRCAFTLYSEPTSDMVSKMTLEGLTEELTPE
jgi:hypothetical protein